MHKKSPPYGGLFPCHGYATKKSMIVFVFLLITMCAFIPLPLMRALSAKQTQGEINNNDRFIWCFFVPYMAVERTAMLIGTVGFIPLHSICCL